MKTPATLRVDLERSPLAAAFICVGCIASAALVGWLPAPFSIRIPAVVLIGCYALWLLRLCADKSIGRAIVKVELGVDRQVCFVDRRGARIEGTVQPDSYVGASLTTIVMKPHGARMSRAIAIFPDMLAANEFRQLRVILRLGHASGDASGVISKTAGRPP